MIDYQVILIHFPSGKTKETVTENEDGSFTIFIEESLSKIEQRNVFLHAMKHILGDDFSKNDVNKIEKCRHNSDLFLEMCF